MAATKSLGARLYRRVANSIEPLLADGLKTPAHYFARRMTHRLEPEFDVLMQMVKPGMSALDAGANIGIYTYGFLARGANVIAVEPQAACAAQIQAFYARGFPQSRERGLLDVRVEALGNSEGMETLYVPARNGRIDDESASLRPLGEGALHVTVPVRRVDDYNLDQLHVMKIDVEGGEAQVLEGAADTVQRCHPIILAEIEQRHHAEPIADVFERIHSTIGPGYVTRFIDRAGKLTPFQDFDVERDQIALQNDLLSHRYVRNFFFLPA